jgi:hypothetical protein
VFPGYLSQTFAALAVVLSFILVPTGSDVAGSDVALSAASIAVSSFHPSSFILHPSFKGA